MDRMLTQTQLRRLITTRSASFAVGVRGVLAEFHWVDDDVVERDDGALEIATARGALALRLRGDEGLTVVPDGPDPHSHPGPDPDPDPDHDHVHNHEHGHPHGRAGGHEHPPGAGTRVCWLPEREADLPSAAGLTELGPDEHAVRPGDRDLRLFDLGLGLGHVRACVRTGDDALVSLLREHQGADVLAPGDRAMAAIRARSPQRVFESASARIEVYQPIPSRARRERTPAGPHTHVLPHLIGTPDTTLERLPDGVRAVLTLYPAH